MKKNFKKLICFTLSFILLVNPLPIYAKTNENVLNLFTQLLNTETTASLEDYNYLIDYQIVNSWEDYKNVNVTIYNTGDCAIEQWALQYDYNGEITNIWNAFVYDSENHIIKNNGYNANILPGESVSFGYLIKGNDFDVFSYKMIQKREIKESGYDVKLEVNFTYGDYFNGNIIISNTTDTPVEAWNLCFDSSFLILSNWSCDIIEEQEYSYRIKGSSNEVIPVNGSVSFGFIGQFEDIIDITNISLSEITVDLTEDDPAQEEQGENQIYQFEEWDSMLDSDEDGLPDVYEDEIGTDPFSADTDHDGLSDGFEVLYTTTDPLNQYTMGDIVDSLLDPDGDGLTMFEEQGNGTDPLEADTDFDGLRDGDELKIYLTNPLLPDSDEDTVKDGDEILIGLDPNNKETFGYPDIEYQYQVSIPSDSDVLSSINKNNTNYQMTLDISGQGDLYSSIFVRESAYTSIANSDFIVGVVPEIISFGEGSLQELTISFKLDDHIISDAYSAEDLKGAKRYNVFKFNEKENILVPVNTVVDVETNTISVSTDEFGTYCILDMEKWLSDLGFEIQNASSDEVKTEEYCAEMNSFYSQNVITYETYDNSIINEENLKDERELSEELAILNNESQQEIFESNTLISLTDVYQSDMELIDDFASFSMPRLLLNEEETVNRDILDIVFCINNNVEGLTEQEFSQIKENLVVLAKTLYYTSPDVRIYILDQHGNVVTTSFGQNYANNFFQVSSMIDSLLNNKPQTQYIDKQINSMLSNISLRDDAFKAAVFFGNSYLSGSSSDLIRRVKAADIHCVIVEPRTQAGSWYDTLSKATNGLLIYNYSNFCESTLNYIYGYIPQVPFAAYTMITSNGLKTVILKKTLEKDGTTDTDYDKLTDWQEINQNRVTVNSDNTVTLPTYYDYMNTYFGGIFWYITWSARYSNLRNKDGKTLDQMLSEIYVLPVISDPTLKDSDEDGINDYDEVNWDGVDERYSDLSPLHKDTIETLFPEIISNGYNKSSYPSYITVDANNVTLHLKIVFKGDTDVKAVNVLKIVDLGTEAQNEATNIDSRLGTDYTLKELIKDAIVCRWQGDYIGSQYDFYNGLNVHFDIDLVENNPGLFERKIEVNIKSGKCGVSNQSGVDWNTNCNRKVTMYTSYCNKHTNTDGSKCTNYQNSLYSIPVFSGTISHEFGHIYGLKDMYASASVNHDYEPQSNSEINYSTSNFGLPSSYGIMRNNGSAVANDIEMILLAFAENKWQYYVPYGKKQKASKAIKSSITYTKTGSSDTYVWNESTHKMEPK